MPRKKPSAAPEAAPLELVDCCMGGCIRKARVKVWRKAWLNICLECYSQLTLTEAREYCRKVGVHNPVEALAFIKATLPRIGRAPDPEPVEEREPGADEGEENYDEAVP